MMKADVIEGLPFEKYLELPGDSSSALKEMLKSPLHYKRSREQRRKDKKPLRMGRAGHSAALEPDRLLLDFAVWRNDKDGNTRRRYGKEWEAFVAANPGKTLINEPEFNEMLRMRDATRSHSVAAKLLSATGRNELTILWTHERTGRRCKSRLDRLTGDVVIDIKTTRDPSPRKFGRDAYELGYLLQAGFYADAAKAIGIERPRFKIIAVQNVEPFDCAVHTLTELHLGQGRDQYNAAMDRIVECEASGVWPGVAPDEVELELPSYAIPAFDESAIEWGEEETIQ